MNNKLFLINWNREFLTMAVSQNTLNQMSQYFYVPNAMTMGDNFALLYNPVKLNLQYDSQNVPVTIEVRNTDETGPNSHASVSTVVANGAGDPWSSWSANGGLAWSAGMRTPDSSAFYLTNQLNLASGTVMKATQSGNVTKPLNCAFSATGSPTGPVTGDGTTYQVIYGNIIFNIGNNYNNSTGVFTAPITGLYRFSCVVIPNGGSNRSVTNYQSYLNTTSQSFPLFNCQGLLSFAQYGVNGCFLCNMTAGDVASVNFVIDTVSGKVFISNDCSFQGELVQ
jgi:hypothetical protein